MYDVNKLSRRNFLSTGAKVLGGISLFGVPNLAFASTGKIRLGLIGCGQRGTGISSILSKIEGIDLTACCDISKTALDNIKKYAAKGAKFYKNYSDLLADKNIDGVIIATPLYMHYKMSVDALDAKKHVYVEKTMTYSIDEAIKLAKKVRSANLVLQVGHQYRYYQMYHKIKEILSEGWIGDITHFESQYNRNSDWRRPVNPGESERAVNWRMYKEYSGGLLAELCAHQIDIVNWMLDSHPKKVVGLGGIDFWKDGRETYDNVRTIYEYEKGIKSSVTSVLSNQYHSYEMKILGSKATIEVRRDQAFIYSEPVKKNLGVVDGVTGATIESLKAAGGKEIEYKSTDGLNLDPTAYALIAFADCIRGNKRPISNVDTGKETAIAVHMGNRAVETAEVQLWDDKWNSN